MNDIMSTHPHLPHPAAPCKTRAISPNDPRGAYERSEESHTLTEPNINYDAPQHE